MSDQPFVQGGIQSRHRYHGHCAQPAKHTFSPKNFLQPQK
jgi:hypothetical protein